MALLYITDEAFVALMKQIAEDGPIYKNSLQKKNEVLSHLRQINEKLVQLLQTRDGELE
jgi:hypothetical protein